MKLSVPYLVAVAAIMATTSPVASGFNNIFAPSKQASKTSSSSTTSYTPPPSKVVTESWLDTLKYPGTPNFDVIAKTIEFAKCNDFDEIEKYYDEEYVFRGPIIGPITAKDVKEAQQGFKITEAYPNLQTRPFGFTIDPDNAYRCYYFERWEGTNTANVNIGPLGELPATNADVKLPTHIISVNWTPNGKIKYMCLSNPLDRFEGTTQGAGAVFGLLIGAGLNAGSGVAVGDNLLRFQQRVTHFIGGFGRSWSKEDDIPSWWKSTSRGADPNDM